MNVILIDESNFKQLIKSRRILSKYFKQISSRTYAGHISQEGLDELFKELREITNRYTSIACFKVATRVRIELLWILGNKNNFDTDGTYCFRQENIRKLKDFKTIFKTKNTTQISMKRLTNPEIVFQNLTKLAALFHDLGKTNIFFQEKLKKGFGCEPFRHELVSFFIVFNFIKKILLNNSNINNEQEFYQYIAQLSTQEIKEIFYSLFDEKGLLNTNINNTNILEQFNHVINAIHNNTNNDKASIPAYLSNLFTIFDDYEIENKKNFNYTIILLWLILTHHKIIGKKINVNNVEKSIYMYREKSERDNVILSFLDTECSAEKFINIAKPPKFDGKDDKWEMWSSEEIIKTLTIDVHNQKFKDSLPWENEEFLLEVKNAFQQIANTMSNDFCMNDLAFLAQLFMRPNLITSDFIGSMNKQDIVSLNDDKCMANTIRENKNSGDTLKQHLKTVGNNTVIINEILANQEVYFRSIDFNDEKFVNKEAMLFQKSLGKFEWQNIVEDDIRQLENKTLPFFGVIISETGSGKTIIAPKIMKNLNKLNRFTLALGFRSLVLQTGKSYAENLGIIENKKNKILTTIIGNKISKDLFDIQNNSEVDDDNDNQINGSESLSLHDNDINITENAEYEQFGKWYQQLFNDIEGSTIYSKNILNIIDYPIIVCTIDYLIRIVEQLNYSDIFSYLRNYSADLILDEIDNYSVKDLISLTKLCFLQGLAGKSLILMSATISQFMTQEFFSAYTKGLTLHNKIKNKSSELNVGMFSNLSDVNTNTNFCKVLTINDNLIDKFNGQYIGFVNSFIEKQKNSPIKKHKLELLHINKAEETSEPINWEKQIIDGVNQLHNNNHILLSVNNVERKFSIGFVRFNNTDKAISLTKHIWEMTNTSDTLILAQAYHSKMSLLVLNYLEQKLNTQLKRSKDDKLIENYVENRMKELDINEKIKNIIFVICTTSIQETGRDHDYDWCILEPSTTRSLVQAAGRVKRHRNSHTENTNIMLLNSPIKELLGQQLAWGFPGVEDEGLFIKPIKPLSDAFNDIVKNSLLQHSFSSKPTITSNLFNDISKNYNSYILSGLSVVFPTKEDVLQNYEYLSHYKSLTYMIENDSKKFNTHKMYNLAYANYKYYEQKPLLKFLNIHPLNTSFRDSSLREIDISLHHFKYLHENNENVCGQISSPAIDILISDKFKKKKASDIQFWTEKIGKNFHNESETFQEKMIYPINKSILLDELNDLISKLEFTQDEKQTPDFLNIFFQIKVNLKNIEKTFYDYALGVYK